MNATFIVFYELAIWISTGLCKSLYIIDIVRATPLGAGFVDIFIGQIN